MPRNTLVTLIGIHCLLTGSAVGQVETDSPATVASQPDNGHNLIEAERLYNGIDRPVMINIAAEPGDGELSLVLLEDDGTVLVPDFYVESGQSIDLAAEMPIVWRIRRACYLQLMRNQSPIGSALVIQPLLSRPPIWTQRETRADGKTRYTRIVGWGTEPPDGWVTPEPVELIDTDGDGVPDTPIETEPDDRVPEIEPEVLSGLRIYPEQDVLIRTTLGDLRVAFAPEEAPNTAWNFLRLAEGGYYDDINFHRIVPLERSGFPFVVQAGDPTSTGSGGPGYWLPLEPSVLPHDFGVISMARADDPDSAGGQFFICLSREGTARLDGQYCAFGYAVEGAATIKSIAAVELADAAAGQPESPPVILSARLISAPARTPNVWRWMLKVRADDGKGATAPVRVPR